MSKEKTMHELMKEHPDKSYREMEKYRDEDRQQEAGACIMGEMRKDREPKKEIDYHRYWKDMYEKEHKLRQEEVKALKQQLSLNNEEAERNEKCLKVYKNRMTLLLNNEVVGKKAERNLKSLEIRLAESLEVNESHQKLNGKLQERLTELAEENKKMHDAFDKQIADARKAGM